MIIDDYLSNDNEQQKVTESDAYCSTCVGIAMEHLGLLSDSTKEYLSDRGGIFLTYVDKETKQINHLTMREMLSLLPD